MDKSFRTTAGPGRPRVFGFHRSRNARYLSIIAIFVEFTAGEDIIRADERHDAVYIVVKGAVEVVVRGAIVDVMAEGSAFGEVAFFDRAPRTATIRSKETGSALVLTRGALEQLALNEPMLALQTTFELGQLLAQRFRPLPSKRLTCPYERSDHDAGRGRHDLFENYESARPVCYPYGLGWRCAYWHFFCF